MEKATYYEGDIVELLQDVDTIHINENDKSADFVMGTTRLPIGSRYKVVKYKHGTSRIKFSDGRGSMDIWIESYDLWIMSPCRMYPLYTYCQLHPLSDPQVIIYKRPLINTIKSIFHKLSTLIQKNRT